MSFSLNDNSITIDKSKFYNSSFNLLSGRKHSLIVQQPNLTEEITITDEVDSEAVEKTVVSIHSFVSHLMTVQKSFETILNNLEFFRLKNSLPRETCESIVNLTLISKHILEQKCDEDGDLYLAKFNYGKSLENYQNQLNAKLQSSTYQKPPDPKFTRKLESVARTLKKLNAARVIKRSLMGAFEFNPSNSENLRTVCRKKLTIEDFLN